jgi:hypothetical protein
VPSAGRGLLSDTGLACIKQVERGLDRIAHRAFGGHIDLIPGVPCGFDGALEIGVSGLGRGHGRAFCLA